MKLYRYTPHESRMGPVDLYRYTPHESRMGPVDLGVKRSKVKVTIHWFLKMVNVAKLLSLYTYHHETSHKDSTGLEGCALWVSGSKGQRSRSQCSDYCFLWRITAFPLHLQSSNFTHRFPVSQEYALLILGLKTWRVWIGWRGGYLSR